MICSPLHHISKDAKTTLQTSLAPFFSHLTYSQIRFNPESPSPNAGVFQRTPPPLSPPPGRADVPLQVNFFCLAAAQPGSLSQVGGRSLEPGGQPSCGGGRRRQPARQRSGNVLLVILIPCSRVSAVAPGGHGSLPCPRPPCQPPSPARFIVVGHRRRTVGKG